MAKRSQLKLLKDSPKAYGGELLKTRKGRESGRPLDTKNSIHLVLRSSLATGPWSFNYRGNSKKVREIISKFAEKNGVQILSLANVGNHIHMQIKLSNRFTYQKFIKAITSAIAMAMTGRNRWSRDPEGSSKSNGKSSKKEVALNELQINALKKAKLGFWDQRPFTRVIIGRNSVLKLKDYIRINEMEGWGFKCSSARDMLEVEKWLKSTT